MSQSFHLYNLQKLDSQISKAEQRLQEIQELIEKDTRIELTQNTHNELEAELLKAQKTLKKVEHEVEGKRIKLELSEANLYSGRVKIPKELQDLQNEVGSIKRSIATIEDHQLEAMLALENLTVEFEQSKNYLESMRATVAEDQAGLNGERNRLAADLERLRIERSAISKQISSENLIKYDHLRKRKRGIAVVSLTDNACMACGSTLTPAESQAARSPLNIILCSSCGRIVYSG